MKGERPKLIDDVENEKMKQLIQKSWCQDPNDRMEIINIRCLRNIDFFNRPRNRMVRRRVTPIYQNVNKEGIVLWKAA